MRLISKFQDYYDTALAQGRDESILYIRKKSVTAEYLSADMIPWAASRLRTVRIKDQTEKSRSMRWIPGYGYEQNSHFWSFDEAFVVIAGKAMPVWIRSGSGQALLEDKKSEDYLGDISIENMVNEMTKRRTQSNTDPNITPNVVASFDNRSDLENRAYDAARERLLSHDFSGLHIDKGGPVLLISSISSLYTSRYYLPQEMKTLLDDTSTQKPNIGIIVNPRLADINFQKLVHPYTCFQDISQFIGGVIPGQQMPMVEISDQSKVQKKGFDPVYGFRRRPNRI